MPEISDELLMLYGLKEISAFYVDIAKRNRTSEALKTTIHDEIFDIIRAGDRRREAAGLTRSQASLGIALATKQVGQRNVYRA